MSDIKNKWTSMLIGVILVLATGILTTNLSNNLRSKSSSLDYITFKTVPFSDGMEETGIYFVQITNNGQVIVENINCVIIIENTSMEDWNIDIDPAIQYTARAYINEDKLEVELPNLNPSEFLSLSIRVSSVNRLPEKPFVSLRGAGVVGKERIIERVTTIDVPWLTISAVVAVEFILIRILFDQVTRRNFIERINSLLAKLREQNDD